MRDLTQGRILPQLLRLALPITGTGFMQLAYNLTDMLWLGHLNGAAVAAASAAGFVIWISFSIAFVAKVGAEVSIAQAIGQGNAAALPSIGAHSIGISLLLSAFLGACIVVFINPIVGFFNLGDEVSVLCGDYTKIYAYIMPLFMLGPTFAGIYNGTGNSRTPFVMSAVGLGINIALDPVLIFGYWGFPALGLRGAAIASAVAVVVEAALFVFLLSRRRWRPYSGFRFFVRFDCKVCCGILRIGGPAALQPALFAFFTTMVARITAQVGGYVGIAVQGAGSQIESLSWTTANGISTALGAYIGQNYGARKISRIIKSFVAGAGAVTAFGMVVGLVFMVLGGEIFALIVPSDALIISEGARYLFILGIAQMFMCAEIAASGAFNGLGKSYVPACVSIVCNGMRIPLAWILSGYWGIAGVWWAICLSTLGKGLLLGTAFPLYVRRLREKWAMRH